MTLAELAQQIANAVEAVKDCGESPDDIKISLQIDGPDTESVWSDEIELHYDNNGQASGCVLVGEFGGNEQ